MQAEYTLFLRAIGLAMVLSFTACGDDGGSGGAGAAGPRVGLRCLANGIVHLEAKFPCLSLRRKRLSCVHLCQALAKEGGLPRGDS